jgi:hypothetical protein
VSSKSGPPTPANTSPPDTLQMLIERFRLINWDAIMVGDGSGSGWSCGAGWGCVIIDSMTRQRKVLWGAANTGTVYLSEIMPYLHGMLWYTAKGSPGKLRRNLLRSLGRRVQIHIFTDSEAVARCGNNPHSRKDAVALWSALDTFHAHGYDLHFQHIPRSELPLNILTDELSRSSRLSLKNAFTHAAEKLQRRFPGLPADLSPYDF